MSSIYVLWDASHLWGLLVVRALREFGVPFSVVRGQAIAQGLLSGKSEPAALVVPGGVARLKADALGAAGMDAVRAYVAGGGNYIGFCGGTGLGLTGAHGLGLCPWQRQTMRDRMLHLVSGHMHLAVPGGHALVPEAIGHTPPAPIWWPARFAPDDNPAVEILGAYTTPGDDFWVADLPLTSLPHGTLADWEAMYGISLRPSSLAGQPCVVSGAYGAGRYVLSYAHLETPRSAKANAWLAHMLRVLAGVATAKDAVGPWDMCAMPVRWDDGVLLRGRGVMDEIVRLGQNHFLLFMRNPWLFGWRAGIPGSHLNHLYALLAQAQSVVPTDAALRFWEARSGDFDRILTLFRDSVTGYLLAERLAMTLSKSFPDAVSPAGLKDSREALFGPPMEGGGLYAALIDLLDELVYLQLAGD
ncbi:MAG: BPL-N domain-containing protein [Desulfovibrionaceae bacterium]